MSVFSVRLASAQTANGTAAWVTVYTVPNDGTVYELRDVLLVNNSAAAAAAVAGLGTAALATQVWVAGSLTQPVGISHFDLRVPLLSGDTLQYYAGAGAQMSVIFSGYHFT